MSLGEGEALSGDVPVRPASPGDSDIQTDVLLRGFLTKRGAVVKNWQVRYFVLEYGRLSYYNDQRCRSRNLKGRIGLADVTEVAALPPEGAWGKANAFRIVGPQRTFYMFSQNVSDRDLWISLIRSQCPNAVHHARLSKIADSTTGPKSVTQPNDLHSIEADSDGEREASDAEPIITSTADTGFGWLEAQTHMDPTLGLPVANFPDIFFPPSEAHSTSPLAAAYYSTIDALFTKMVTLSHDLRPHFYHPGPLLDQLKNIAQQFTEISQATATRLVSHDSEWQLYESGVLYTVVTRVPGLDADFASKLITYEMKHRKFIAPELLPLGLHLPLMAVFEVSGHRVTAVALPQIVDRNDWQTSPLVLARLDRLRHRLRLNHLGTMQLVRGCDGRHFATRLFGLFPLKPPTAASTAGDGDPLPVVRFAHPNSVVHLAGSAGGDARHDNSVINAVFRRSTSSDGLDFSSVAQFRAWLSTSAISLHMLGELVYLSSDRSAATTDGPTPAAPQPLRVTLETLPSFPAPAPPDAPTSPPRPVARESSSSVNDFPGFRLANVGLRVTPLPNVTPLVVLTAKPHLPQSWLRYAIEELCVRSIRRALIRRFRAGSSDSARHLLGQLFLCQDERLALLSTIINSTYFSPFGLEFSFTNASLVNLPTVFRRLLKSLPLFVAETRTPLDRVLANHTETEFPALQLGAWPRVDPESPVLDVARGLLLGDWGHSSPHTHTYRGLLAISVGNGEHGLESLSLASALFGGPLDEPAILQFGLGVANPKEFSPFRCFSAMDFLDTVDSLICLSQSATIPDFLDRVKDIQVVSRNLKMQGVFPRMVTICTLQPPATSAPPPGAIVRQNKDNQPTTVFCVFESTCLSIWLKEQTQPQLRLPYSQIERFEPTRVPSASSSSSSASKSDHLDSDTQVRIRSSQLQEDFILLSKTDPALWTQLIQPEEPSRFPVLCTPVAKQLSGLLRQIQVLRGSMDNAVAEHPGFLEQLDCFTLPNKVVGYDSISQARVKLHLYRSASLPSNLIGVESSLVLEAQQLLVWLKTCYDNMAARVALHAFATSINSTPGVFFDVFPTVRGATSGPAVGSTGSGH